ncbi:polyphosphate kinase 1 [Lujinxingia litoralis]|uniref:Polyphosphate kinase n=1 Tax=Lujinxingia litoralis TaxID=2211119 RepID=A0A328C4B0_9DELT|nr:polyphosphate kinase 1 [Lujinxingia litoralis]RAL20142.1 polyphosphate kinase 1 [Lujinxingia litoralis]
MAKSISLRDPGLYLNRELNWLAFNERVLAMAQDERVPLLERLKFLCISSTNLDEFFEIRVARLKHEIALDAEQIGPDGMRPREVLGEIGERCSAFVQEQYRLLNEVIIPELAEQGVRFLKRADWSARQRAWVERYFEEEVLPVLSPMGIDPVHPFPRVVNKSLNFVVSLEGKDAFGRASRMAVVPAPRCLPRLIQVPREVSGGAHDYVFLSSVIHAHVDELFAGMSVTGCYQFRITRNSELYVDEEEVEDLMIALEDELYARNYGEAVRLEVADNCPMDVARFLLEQCELGEADLYQVMGPVNLNRLMMIPADLERADLKYPGFMPAMPTGPIRHGEVFEAIGQGTVLMHHPYQSFFPVLEFIRQAAADPNVLAIKQTLYRSDPESPIPQALAEAARAGKEVTAVVELRARFDEAFNIAIANRLQDAGAHVLYGVMGHKTHAKMSLVVRREAGGLKRYVHLSTGNYNPRTARHYTDFGLMTADETITADVHRVFQQLTGLGKALKLKKVVQAPFHLHKRLLRLIRHEIKAAKAGEPALIRAKMNQLTEPRLIRELYKASQAGVQIELVVRGICCLRPGVPGVSENIRLRSILGRFLEHSRVYYFHHGGDPKVYLASADWMQRNMFRRIEVAFPIEDEALRARVIEEGLDVHFRDTANAWDLGPEGDYRRVGPGEEEKAFVSQQGLLKSLSEG